MTGIIFSIVKQECLGSDFQLARLAIPVQSQLSEHRSTHWYPITSVSSGFSALSILLTFLFVFMYNRFTSCWTCLTAGAYSLVFYHSAWSRHPIASVGAQAVWIFVTWLCWIVGAGILNAAASSFLLHGGMCGPGGVVYCGQIRALFGALHTFFIVIFLYSIQNYPLWPVLVLAL